MHNGNKRWIPQRKSDIQNLRRIAQNLQLRGQVGICPYSSGQKAEKSHNESTHIAEQKEKERNGKSIFVWPVPKQHGPRILRIYVDTAGESQCIEQKSLNMIKTDLGG